MKTRFWPSTLRAPVRSGIHSSVHAAAQTAGRAPGGGHLATLPKTRGRRSRDPDDVILEASGSRPRYAPGTALRCSLPGANRPNPGGKTPEGVCRDPLFGLRNGPQIRFERLETLGVLLLGFLVRYRRRNNDVLPKFPVHRSGHGKTRI